MDQTRLAPLVGIGGCLGVLGVLVYPYLVTDGPVGVYYASGVLNPLIAGLLAAVTVVVFAAGREERTDPSLAAGTALVFGAFVALILLGWTLTVRIDALEISPLHRWIAVALAGTIPVAGAWYARALRLF